MFSVCSSTRLFSTLSFVRHESRFSSLTVVVTLYRVLAIPEGRNARSSPRERSGTRLSRVRTMCTRQMRPVGPRPYVRVPGIVIMIVIIILRIYRLQNTVYVFLNAKRNRLKSKVIFARSVSFTAATEYHSKRRVFFPECWLCVYLPPPSRTVTDLQSPQCGHAAFERKSG